jgi:hypothetical protein
LKTRRLHVRELRLVGADVGHLMRDDKMVRRIDGRLQLLGYEKRFHTAWVKFRHQPA